MSEQPTIETPTIYIFDLDALSVNDDVVDGDIFKLLYMLSERCRVAVISWKSFDEIRTILPLDTIGFLSQGGNVADLLLGGEAFPLWNKKLEKEDARYARKRAKQFLREYNQEKDETNFEETDSVIAVSVLAAPEQRSDVLNMLTNEVTLLPKDAKYALELSPDSTLRYAKQSVEQNVWEYFELIAQHQPVKNPQFIVAGQSFNNLIRYQSSLEFTDTIGDFIYHAIERYEDDKRARKASK